MAKIGCDWLEIVVLHLTWRYSQGYYPPLSVKMEHTKFLVFFFLVSLWKLGSRPEGKRQLTVFDDRARRIKLKRKGREGKWQNRRLLFHERFLAALLLRTTAASTSGAAVRCCPYPHHQQLAAISSAWYSRLWKGSIVSYASPLATLHNEPLPAAGTTLVPRLAALAAPWS